MKPGLQTTLAPTLSDAQHCINALGAQASKDFLAFNRRFDAGHAALKRAIELGEIGNLEQLTITSRDPAPPPLDYIPKSGGLFRDMMIHDLDMARWLLGEEPVSLYSRGSCLVDPQIGKLGDIDTACVVLVTSSDKQAVILNSRRAAYGYDQRIEAFGSAGMVISDNPRATGIRRFPARASGRRIVFSRSTWTVTGTATAGKSKPFLVAWRQARRPRSMPSMAYGRPIWRRQPVRRFG